MNTKEIIRHCLNYKVLAGVAAVIALVYLFAPQLAQYASLLLLLACPASMILMMAMMNRGGHKTEKLFTCSECGLSYTDAAWATRCAVWCKEHKSCNLEITEHAVK